MTSNKETIKNTDTSNDTKTLITAIALMFIYPIGLPLMWFWTKWKLWVKILISLPVLLVFAFVAFVIFLVGASPTTQINIDRGNCMKTCTESNEQAACVEYCSNPENYLPN